jgi:hypothetical protein
MNPLATWLFFVGLYKLWARWYRKHEKRLLFEAFMRRVWK